jgi:hypothetical protein
VTVLDDKGRPVGEDETQFMAPMLFTWLADQRLGRILIEQRIFSPRQIMTIAGNIQRGLREQGDKARFPPEELRRAVYAILSNRIARISVARLVLQREAEIREEWDEVEACPPPRDRKLVMRELQEMREQLATFVESKIVRPFE